MPRRSNRKRCRSNSAPVTPTVQTKVPKPKRKSRAKITPTIKPRRHKRQTKKGHTRRKPVVPDVPTTSASDPSTNPATMSMCACGLLHEDAAVVEASHNAHAFSCKLRSDATPPMPMPAFKPTSNVRIMRRKKGNTAHLERSAFNWATRWLRRNKRWPDTFYPWVQWAINYHPESEFIWYAGSSPDQVATRGEDFAERHSRSREDFAAILKTWWQKHAIVLLPLRNRAFKQKSRNEHVAMSCCALTLSETSVAKVVKEQRKTAFKDKMPGYQLGMKECPNCGEKGLFVHDGSSAKCVHPKHEMICEALKKKKEEEERDAELAASAPRTRKCSTCACYGIFKPGEFKPTPGEKVPVRCKRHICLSADKMEIACGGQCDGCMQVFCSRCDRCK